MRRRAWALIAVAAIGPLVWAALAIDFGGTGSPRKAAVERLLAAARAGDEAAMRGLLTPDAQLIGYSSFDTQYVPARHLADGLSECPTIAMSEALGVVAVDLGCDRDRHGRYVLDFTFCGDRVARISSNEDGRWMLSPIARELGRRLFGGAPLCS